MLQLRVKRDENSYLYNLSYSDYWAAETEEDLIREYAEHLFEHDRTACDDIIDVHRVCNNGRHIETLSNGDKWELSDKINEALESMHNEYLDYRQEQDELYEDYKRAVL